MLGTSPGRIGPGLIEAHTAGPHPAGSHHLPGESARASLKLGVRRPGPVQLRQISRANRPGPH